MLRGGITPAVCRDRFWLQESVWRSGFITKITAIILSNGIEPRFINADGKIKARIMQYFAGLFVCFQVLAHFLSSDPI